jgi:glycosyltransferase involved in cell wall biosynthesis
VDDNSTDETYEIAKNQGCDVVKFPYDHPNWVARKELAQVFNLGLEQCDDMDLDYIMILGADHILSEDYVQRVWEKMQSDNTVVASGSIGDEYAVTPRGSGRLIDYKWFKRLGLRYPINYGYESYLIMKSLQMGYEKGYYPEIKSTTQRKTAVMYKPLNYYYYGHAYRALGYSRNYTILKCIILIKKRKYLSSLYFLAGFFLAKKPYYEDGIRDYISNAQNIKFTSLFDRKKVAYYIERFIKS